MRRLLLVALALGLAACASAPKKSGPDLADADKSTVVGPSAPGTPVSPYAAAQEDPGTRGDYVAGGLYKPGMPDSAPEHVPDVDNIPEPAIIAEPRSRAGNRSSYTVLGKQYRVMPSAQGYVEEGIASYYGQKFHGRRTSNLEVYDMYAFTAAHKTLPLPTFVRVTNLDNGKSLVLRVNDRGPFHAGRIIDLSYAAAVKLGITKRGTGRVEVRALTPDGRELANASAPAKPEARATASRASGMDRLVASSGGEQRFDLRADGKAMTADEFDVWMKARRVTVATGKPAPAPARRAAAPAAPAAQAIAATTPMVGPVVLQVASFAARGNADRALALLRDAGIDGARLDDADANGQKVWRLRVGPLASAIASDITARIVGLGFGSPQPVRE